jgi:hypothetical protein
MEALALTRARRLPLATSNVSTHCLSSLQFLHPATMVRAAFAAKKSNLSASGRVTVVQSDALRRLQRFAPVGALAQPADPTLPALAQLELDEVAQQGLEGSAVALRRSRDLLVVRRDGGQLQGAQEHPQGGLAHDATSSESRLSSSIRSTRGASSAGTSGLLGATSALTWAAPATTSSARSGAFEGVAGRSRHADPGALPRTSGSTLGGLGR